MAWWADNQIVRRVADAVVRGVGRRRVAELDRLAAEAVQVRTLTRLVRQAHRTRFGRDHDFRRIRCLDDFHRLVPLCTPLDLWHAYWATSYPHLKDVTWPGPADFANDNSGWPTPMTADLTATNRVALEAALALVVQARPRARLLHGQILVIGDTADPCPLPLPHFVHPYALDATTGDLDDWVLRSSTVPVTCLVGEVGRVRRFLDALLRLTNREDVREVWSELAAVLVVGHPSLAERTQLSEELTTRRGEAPVLVLEVEARPEAVLAVEDPRYGLPRVLPHHGVFFEFVPIEDVQQPRPARHTLANIEVGVAYAVAVTTPGGLWACLPGWTVCFERRDPPLLRVLAADAVFGPASRLDPATALPGAVQPPHTRNGVVLGPMSDPTPRPGRRKVS